MRWSTRSQEQTVQLLALRQPMARDLREIVCALKIAGDLERIGDYAANVAKRSHRAEPGAGAAVGGGRHRPRMGAPGAHGAQGRARRLRSSDDVAKAHDVWQRDEEIDEIYTGLFRELLTYMMEDPRTITACTHLLFMAKNIERIGDHATNIAETGALPLHRPAASPRRGRRATPRSTPWCDRVMSMAAQAPSRRDAQTGVDASRSSWSSRTRRALVDAAALQPRAGGLPRRGRLRRRGGADLDRRRTRPTWSCSTGCCR